jgi:hypothetical protein
MKRSLTLIIVLAVLIGIYWLVQSRRPVVATDRPFVEFDSAAVNLLRMETATDTVELRKEGEQWNLLAPLKFPAAQKSVQQAVGKLREMKKLTLVTSNPDKQGEFQVDNASGVRLTIGQGNKTATIVIGKAGSTGQTSYARLADSKDIWEIGGSHAATFKRKAKDWRDKTITEIDKEAFKKFVLRYPDQTITVTRADTVWTVDTGKGQFAGSSDQVGRLTNLLSRMSCVDFADTLKADAFDKSALQLTAELTTGQTIDLKLIPKDAEASQYFVRKMGAPADYIIYKSTANVLMKRADDFKEKAEDSSDKPMKNPRKS